MQVGISVRYPLVELFTALACTFAAYQFGVTSQALLRIVYLHTRCSAVY